MPKSLLVDVNSRLGDGRRLEDDSPMDWSSYAQLMKKYDEDMVRGWKEEIDTLLVFAGLFSAVVTAFNIEAYKLLQNDPSQLTIQLLQDISQQLSLARGDNTSNVTTDITSRSTAGPSVVQSIRINVLWFSSLVCALFAALLGMMVKQWLREYMAAILFSSRHSVRLRQHRYEGLIAWHVPEIMAVLPILLEASLILFFAGLVDFLWLLQSTVATVVTCLVALALLCYVITAIVPVFSSQCPFKSPQAWMFTWLFVRCRTRLARWKRRLRASLPRFQRRRHDNSPPSTHHFADWRDRDNMAVWDRRHDLDVKAVSWIQASFVDDVVQDSLISVIPDLRTDHAIRLVFTAIAREAQQSPLLFVNSVRERACGELLRTIGARLDKPSKARIFGMLLGLLEHIPTDYDSSTAGLGALDALWTLWEICRAEDQDTMLHPSILNGIAKLLNENQPFRLRRAALNMLYETTRTWTYLHCPAAIGNIISFARSCHRHGVPDMFLKAAAVALLLSPGLDWNDEETILNHRQQLKELLRDLSRFLKQCNEAGIRHEEGSASKLVYGLALLVEKDTELIEAILPDVLLEGVDLGLLCLSHDEHLKLQGMQHTRVPVHSSTNPNGIAL